MFLYIISQCHNNHKSLHTIRPSLETSRSLSERTAGLEATFIAQNLFRKNIHFSSGWSSLCTHCCTSSSWPFSTSTPTCSFTAEVLATNYIQDVVKNGVIARSDGLTSIEFLENTPLNIGPCREHSPLIVSCPPRFPRSIL